MRRQLIGIASALAAAACSSTADTSPGTTATHVDTAAELALGGRRPFPADNAWNTDVSAAPVDPKSSTLIASCGLRNLHPDFGTVYDGAPNGIPFVVVHAAQAKVPVSFDYSDEGDPGPYPVPADAPIEGGPSSTGDRHVLVVDVDAWKLYERYDAAVQAGAINHALRFTCPRTRKAYITPARHYASSDTSSSLPPMGMRVR